MDGGPTIATWDNHESLKCGFDGLANSFGYLNIADDKTTASIATFLGLDHDVVKVEMKKIDSDANDLVSFAEFALWADRHTVGIPLGLDSVPDKREWRKGMPAYWTSVGPFAESDAPALPPAAAPAPPPPPAPAPPAPARARAAPAAAAPAPVVEDYSELEDFIAIAKEFSWDKVWEMLARHPYYINKRPEYRRWAVVHQAAYHGDVAVLRKLVSEYGADPGLLTKDGQTPTQVASEHGKAEVVEYLKEAVELAPPSKKAKPDGDGAATVDQANEIIEKAKWAKWPEMFELIKLHPGAENLRPEFRVFGAIHQAAYHGNVDILRKMVEGRADPGLLTRDKETALQVALKQAHGEAVAYLSGLAAGAGSGGAKNEEQQAHDVIDAAKNGEWELAFSLLDKGPAGLVNMRPEVRLWGVFHQAAFHGDVEVLRRLIEDYQANVKALTKDAKNALQIAREELAKAQAQGTEEAAMMKEAVAKYLEACVPNIKLDDDFVTYPAQSFVILKGAELNKFHDLLADTHKKNCNWTRDRDWASGKFQFKTPVPSGYELVGVRRNENPALWRIYQVSREIMRMECEKPGLEPFKLWTPQTAERLDWSNLGLRAEANEWFLFHAGLPEALSAIARTGFTMAKLGSGGTTGGGGLYGNGTYFADSITKADEYARRKVEEKGMFKGCRAVALVRVLGGRHFYTEQEVSEEDKPKFAKRVLEGSFHSTVGDRLKLKNTFREYVAYDSAATYLEFILYYRRKGVPKKHE